MTETAAHRVRAERIAQQARSYGYTDIDCGSDTFAGMEFSVVTVTAQHGQSFASLSVVIHPSQGRRTRASAHEYVAIGTERVSQRVPVSEITSWLSAWK